LTTDALIVVFAGLLAGYLAELLVKARGHGMSSDAMLGVGGSLAAGTLFNIVASVPDREWLPMAAVAFAGSVLVIVAQRVFWRATRPQESPS